MLSREGRIVYSMMGSGTGETGKVLSQIFVTLGDSHFGCTLLDADW